jgi:hypothetical protein
MLEEHDVVAQMYQGILLRRAEEISSAEVAAALPSVKAPGGVLQLARMMLDSEEFRRKARLRSRTPTNDMQSLMRRRRKQLLFDHVPKTAGRSTVAFLEQWLGLDRVLDVNMVEDLLATPMEELFTADVIAGHLGLQSMEWLPWLSRFTVLRDPLARLVSQYAHLTRELAMGGALKSLADRSSVSFGFKAWYDSRLSRGEQNTMALWLTQPLVVDTNTPAGTTQWGLTGRLDQSTLADDVKLAFNALAVVGVIEEFDHVARRLEDWFERKLAAPPPLPWKNQGGETDRLIAEMSPRSRRWIEQHEAIDFELWETARTAAR